MQLNCRVDKLSYIQVLYPTEVPLVALIYFSRACFYAVFCLLISLGFFYSSSLLTFDFYTKKIFLIFNKKVFFSSLHLLYQNLQRERGRYHEGRGGAEMLKINGNALVLLLLLLPDLWCLTSYILLFPVLAVLN